MIEQQRIYYRYATRGRIFSKNRASNVNQGRPILNHKGMVLAQVRMDTEIRDFEGWKNNSRGSF